MAKDNPFDNVGDYFKAVDDVCSDVFFGYPPQAKRCETEKELAEWFGLFEQACRVAQR
jgi:hypothetical protein